MNNLQAIDLLKGLEQSLDDYCELNDEGKTAFRMAITALELFGNSEQLPSAQTGRKKGRWVEFDSDEDKFDIIKCSCCKHTFTVDSYHWTDIGFVKDDFNFCPNCGADMRGDKE